MQEALDTLFLSKGDTAKLRGQWGWADTATHGRIGRFATWHLKQHQYYKDSEIVDEHFARVLTFMARLAQVAPLRHVSMFPNQRTPVLIYSDASWEPGKVNRVGWIVQTDLECIGYTMAIDDTVMASWCQRKTQIVMAAAFALIMVLKTCRDKLRGRDVIWFIDNEAVCAAAIRGSSSAEDVQDIVQTSAFMALEIHCRIWYEWIDSDSNISDGLSRVGLKCGLANAICSSLVEVPPFEWKGRDHASDFIL